MPKLKSKYRTHTCGELTAVDSGLTVTLSGWINKNRDHGAIQFLDLRDNYGVTQVVVSEELVKKLEGVRVESVIKIIGIVAARSEKSKNKNISTGEIELIAQDIEVLTNAVELPFQVSTVDNSPENIRLTYRFLELRREELHNNILLKTKVIKRIREIMHELGFNEFQTPILTSSSPEGARDFLVPSRFHPGKFFALPQAPQQFKQLLMVAGFDRYFQIAPCFRDEDPRADRSPGEFYQLDLEMSFVEQEDVFQIAETVFSKLFSEFGNNAKVTNTPFPRIPYHESIKRYGTDKPDLRNPLEIFDVTQVFSNTEFKVFKDKIVNHQKIFCIAVENKQTPSRKVFDDIIADYKEYSKGETLGYLVNEGKEFKGSLAKVVTAEEGNLILQKLNIDSSKAYSLYIAAGEEEATLSAVGKLRIKLGNQFDLLEKNAFRFCFIVDFPMYERNLDTGKLEFSHNPFSMPQGGLNTLRNQKPLDIKAYQYDVVCNGYEIVSGAIRNHQPEIMYKAFEIAGYKKEQVDAKFGGMIKAFQFGAPPHGGMAAGIDRLVMLLANKDTIRSVIPFPMAQTVEDLMMSAPSTVTFQQLKTVHIQLAEGLEYEVE